MTALYVAGGTLDATQMKPDEMINAFYVSDDLAQCDSLLT